MDIRCSRDELHLSNEQKLESKSFVTAFGSYGLKCNFEWVI